MIKREKPGRKKELEKMRYSEEGARRRGKVRGGVEAVQRSKLGGERKRGWKRKSEPERMRAVSGETKQK